MSAWLQRKCRPARSQELQRTRVDLAAIVENPERLHDFRIARICLECLDGKIVGLRGIDICREFGIEQGELPNGRRVERILGNDLLVGFDRLVQLSVALRKRCEARQGGGIVRPPPQVTFEVGVRVADTPSFPVWKTGSEFKARRDAMLKSARP